MKKLFSAKFYILLLMALVIICGVVIIGFGREYTFRYYINGSQEVSDYSWEMENGDVLEILDVYFKNSNINVKVRYLSPGIEYIDFQGPEGYGFLFVAYAHWPGIITDMYRFGNSTCSWIIPVCVIVFLVFALYGLILKYRKDCTEDLYQYKNITTLGLIVFIGFLILHQIMSLINYNGFYFYLHNMITSAGAFSVYSFPIALLLSILVTFSNVNLMRKEGRNPRNMLGIVLGIILCIAIISPDLISNYIYYHTTIDVHRETGVPRHIMMFLENALSALCTYIECILIGTIGVALKAARHIPAFDKDYIIIHGCQVKKDGSLTKLLQGRADTALEFAKMQKEATGKDIVFVPSGGKGADEPVSEAEAISSYLISKGVSEDRILLEDKSSTTLENLRFSYALIKESQGFEDPKIAISTTNYHVFRAGMYASELGLKAEGIGSKTKRYFWVNAFVREFAATLVSERKRHLRIILTLLLIVLLMVVLVYFAVQI